MGGGDNISGSRGDADPRFVFICGPVGCGNTFLFRCLTEDDRTYGINEGDLGGTLRRLVDSTRELDRCPHATAAFATFMRALAGDRETFVEKSPSNIRHQALLREALPGARFLFTVREPRAAIASGLSGRSLVNEVEHVARLWRSDCDLIAQGRPDDLTIVYDDFVRDPVPTLERIANSGLPLSDAAYRFAERVVRPDRADPGRWRRRVDRETAERIERQVHQQDLDGCFEAFRGGDPTAEPAPTPLRTGLWQRTRAQLFSLYYRRS